MTFEQSIDEAARAADEAVRRVMLKYAAGHLTDEDDITPALVSRLDEVLEGKIGGLSWTSTVVRHRSGVAAQEKRVGADLVIHARMDTPDVSYSKGLLVQAKRIGQSDRLTSVEKLRLDEQCDKMLRTTASSFVFDYAPGEMRCGDAADVRASKERDLFNQCQRTPYGFFFDFFRCDIGDHKLTSAFVDDLPVPLALHLRAEGNLKN